MDKKTFECLSRGMMILAEGVGEKYGVEFVNARVVLVDDVVEEHSTVSELLAEDAIQDSA